MITLIAARARNGAIGRNNEIPWFAPEDLKAFQKETTGGALIMGRRTWESLPVRPLKARLNIVISRNPDIAEHVMTDLSDAIRFAYQSGYSRLYGIGGEAIYRDLLPVADRLLLTEVDLDVEGADAFFPTFDDADWHELRMIQLGGDGPTCRMRELMRNGYAAKS